MVPGRCDLSFDIRSGSDATRKTAVHEILANIAQIARHRGVATTISEVMDEPAVPCALRLQDSFAASITRMNLPLRRLPSGAGHDAVMFSSLTDIGMLFVRCGNGGISHSPQESVEVDDVNTAARILLDVLINLDAV
jgi:allantoate deiminase/N-carbamoyl-L-amino-acid hydrolase